MKNNKSIKIKEQELCKLLDHITTKIGKKSTKQVSPR